MSLDYALSDARIPKTPGHLCRVNRHISPRPIPKGNTGRGLSSRWPRAPGKRENEGRIHTIYSQKSRPQPTDTRQHPPRKNLARPPHHRPTGKRSRSQTMGNEHRKKAKWTLGGFCTPPGFEVPSLREVYEMLLVSDPAAAREMARNYTRRRRAINAKRVASTATPAPDTAAPHTVRPEPPTTRQ